MSKAALIAMAFVCDMEHVRLCVNANPAIYLGSMGMVGLLRCITRRRHCCCWVWLMLLWLLIVANGGVNVHLGNQCCCTSNVAPLYAMCEISSFVCMDVMACFLLVVTLHHSTVVGTAGMIVELTVN